MEGDRSKRLRIAPDELNMMFFLSSRSWMCSIAFSVALVALPHFAIVAAAQVGGSLSGTIKDSTGGVIPGATVSLMNTAIGTQLDGVSDAQGHYSFPNVSVGRYDLTVTLEGFKPSKRTGVAVNTDSRLQIDATLEVGGLTDTVTVSRMPCASKRCRPSSAKSWRPQT